MFDKKFTEKQNKYLKKLKFHEKAVYRLLFIENEFYDVVDDILNPILKEENINELILDRFDLLDEFKNTKKNRKDILTDVVDIIKKSPKTSFQKPLYFIVPKSDKNIISKIFHRITEIDDNNLFLSRKSSFDNVKENYYVFSITINNNAQFFPITINQTLNYVLPPVYKWKLKSKTKFHDVLKSDDKLVVNIRNMMKYHNLDVDNYILSNKFT